MRLLLLWLWLLWLGSARKLHASATGCCTVLLSAASRGEGGQQKFERADKQTSGRWMSMRCDAVGRSGNSGTEAAATQRQPAAPRACASKSK